MADSGKIYTLTDPRTGTVRYVGFTALDLDSRLRSHIDPNHLRSFTHKNNWIKLLLNENLCPFIEEVDNIEIENWQFWERYWISQFKCWNFPLTNMTDGGNGMQKGYKRGPRSKTHQDKLSVIWREKMFIRSTGGKIVSSKEMTCPICGYIGKAPNIYRSHFNRCKNK